MKDSEVSENLGKAFPKAYDTTRMNIEKVTVKIWRTEQGTNAGVNKSELYQYTEVSLPRVKWMERPDVE